MQCQLTLFNVGYLKGSEGQSVYTLHCYSLRPAGSAEKKPCEKKSSTTDTEEVHNANSFTNTTDCFHHNEGKQPLLLSSTSTNNTLTKPPNPRFVPRQNLLDRLNAPRVDKKKFFRSSSLFPQERKSIITIKAEGRERNGHWTCNASSLTDMTTFSVFWSHSWLALVYETSNNCKMFRFVIYRLLQIYFILEHGKIKNGCFNNNTCDLKKHVQVWPQS